MVPKTFDGTTFFSTVRVSFRLCATRKEIWRSFSERFEACSGRRTLPPRAPCRRTQDPHAPYAATGRTIDAGAGVVTILVGERSMTKNAVE
jgi:hypothetical protein